MILILSSLTQAHISCEFFVQFPGLHLPLHLYLYFCPNSNSVYN
uniref:Uncharacterized protein n=1 Tax=Rhizophora mucronata TaxID=61149 RepID=A0A2P2MU41_RHIMU